MLSSVRCNATCGIVDGKLAYSVRGNTFDKGVNLVKCLRRLQLWCDRDQIGRKCVERAAAYPALMPVDFSAVVDGPCGDGYRGGKGRLSEAEG